MNAWLLAAMIAAQSLDLGTTMEGLARGCRERTYFFKGSGAIAASKLSATAGLTWTLPIMHKRGKTKSAKTIAWAVLVSGAVGGALNLRTLPRCR